MGRQLVRESHDLVYALRPKNGMQKTLKINDLKENS